eukprot:Awhi_evm1s6658
MQSSLKAMSALSSNEAKRLLVLRGKMMIFHSPTSQDTIVKVQADDKPTIELVRKPSELILTMLSRLQMTIDKRWFVLSNKKKKQTALNNRKAHNSYKNNSNNKDKKNNKHIITNNISDTNSNDKNDINNLNDNNKNIYSNDSISSNNNNNFIKPKGSEDNKMHFKDDMLDFFIFDKAEVQVSSEKIKTAMNETFWET